jgi:CII-binding regulator of phage lambda lysogenization HflD
LSEKDQLKKQLDESETIYNNKSAEISYLEKQIDDLNRDKDDLIRAKVKLQLKMMVDHIDAVPVVEIKRKQISTRN